ncbi:hypothetical protein I79_013831 [Cricetulus griseus]|uniref:Uncharacterized protein n=1 Tax=Cricetulus griseus TaxID=10029 RepID=G3HSJ8_CRIGR|nr:hypothetical protein I79_013831 [Cricetulus griseus]
MGEELMRGHRKEVLCPPQGDRPCALPSAHVDPVEVHTPVGPGPRGDEAVTMLAG